MTVTTRPRRSLSLGGGALWVIGAMATTMVNACGGSAKVDVAEPTGDDKTVVDDAKPPSEGAEGGSEGEAAGEPDNATPKRADRVHHGGYETGYTLLLGQDIEESGFGLYSYILIRRAPMEEEQIERVVSVLEAVIAEREVSELRDAGFEKAELNVGHIPVCDDFDPEGIGDPAIVFQKYNYARAKHILSLLPEDRVGEGDGPYIVSTDAPVGNRRGLENVERLIVQDFTNVHPRVVSLWVREFVHQTKRANWWEPSLWSTVKKHLRNVLANSAEYVSQVEQAFRQILGDDE
jgi:hypothetical protein